MSTPARDVSGSDSSFSSETEGAISQVSARRLQQLNAQLGDDHPLVAADPDAIYRFLKVAKGDIRYAKKLIEQHIQWRTSALPVQLTPELTAELCKGKVYLSGFDRAGRPIVVLRSGRFDPRRRNLHEALQALTYYVEQALETRPAGVDQIVFLYDRRGFSLAKNWDYELVKNALQLMASHYPCLLHKCYFYPVTPVLAGLVRLMKPFTDRTLTEAAEFVTSSESLLELIPAQHVPLDFGGESTVDFDRASILGGAGEAEVASRASDSLSLSQTVNVPSHSSRHLTDVERMSAKVLPPLSPSDESDGSALSPRARIAASVAALASQGLDEESTRAQLDKLVECEERRRTVAPGASECPSHPPQSPIVEASCLKEGSQNVLEQIGALQTELNRVGSVPAVEQATVDRQLNDVLVELLVSEARYVADLQCVCDKFLTPLRSVLDGPMHAKLFSNVQQLRDLHLEIVSEVGTDTAQLADLSQKADRVATGFLKVIPFFRMYSVFCCAQEGIREAIEAVHANTKAKAIVEAAQGSTSVLLAAYLFRPVQRMCSYALFFQKAAKYAHDDKQRQRFKTLFDKVQDVVALVDTDVQRQSGQRRAADVLLHEVGGDAADLLVAHRKLALEVDVEMQLCSGVHGDWLYDGTFLERRTYHWYLFSDLLLLARPHKLREGYKEKLRLPLDSVLKLTVFKDRGFELQAQRSDGKSKAGIPNLIYHCWAKDANERTVIMAQLKALLAAKSQTCETQCKVSTIHRNSSSCSISSCHNDSIKSRGPTMRAD